MLIFNIPTVPYCYGLWVDIITIVYCTVLAYSCTIEFWYRPVPYCYGPLALGRVGIIRTVLYCVQSYLVDFSRLFYWIVALVPGNISIAPRMGRFLFTRFVT